MSNHAQRILQYITWVVRCEQERSDERANGYQAHSVPLWICQWINWASVGLVHCSVLKRRQNYEVTGNANFGRRTVHTLMADYQYPPITSVLFTHFYLKYSK